MKRNKRKELRHPLMCWDIVLQQRGIYQLFLNFSGDIEQMYAGGRELEVCGNFTFDWRKQKACQIIGNNSEFRYKMELSCQSDT